MKKITTVVLAVLFTFGMSIQLSYADHGDGAVEPSQATTISAEGTLQTQELQALIDSLQRQVEEISHQIKEAGGETHNDEGKDAMHKEEDTHAEHSDETHMEAMEATGDLKGIHIMSDGSVMLGTGEVVHEASITEDGTIKLSDGVMVKPAMDLRAGGSMESGDHIENSSSRDISCEFNRNLTEGVSGEEVECLQDFLKKKGHFDKSIQSTGFFGPVTRTAVAAWQAEHGISPAVGYFGPLSRAEFGKLRMSMEMHEEGDEHSVEEHAMEHDRLVDVTGLHIMADGAVMLSDDTLLKDAVITSDDMVKLDDGRIVKPELDLRPGKGGTAADHMRLMELYNTDASEEHIMHKHDEHMKSTVTGGATEIQKQIDIALKQLQELQKKLEEAS